VIDAESLREYDHGGEIQRGHFPKEIILTGVRWYVAYPLSTRHVEELMLERGVHVDHSTINRWVIKYSPSWRRRSIDASARCGSVGGWMRPISR
jgi:transposase-like protein